MFLTIKKSKKYRDSIIKRLCNKGILTKGGSHLCSGCYEDAIKQEADEEMDVSTGSCSIDHPLENVESEKQETKMKIDDQLVDAIEIDVKKFVNDDKKTLEQLKDYDSESWVQERPQELVDLISKLTGNEESQDIALLIELIYGMRNKRLVLPILEKSTFNVCFISQ